MKQKSIKQNFVMNIILTLSSFIFPLITFPYVSRVLAPDGIGKVSFAISFIAYFNMIAQLGIPTYGIRACAKVRDDKIKLTETAHELLIINFIMSIFAYIILTIALLCIPKLWDERFLYIIVSCNIMLTSIGMEWLYKALEQYAYITVRSIIFKFFALILMFLLIHDKSDYVVYGAISIFAGFASNICNFINVHKFIKLKPLKKHNLKRHIKPVVLFFAMSFAATIYTNLDIVMLGFMAGDADVGYYNAAVKIKVILVSIVTSLGTVLLPRVSYYIEHELMDEFKHISRKALNFVFLLASPMTLYFMIFAEQGIIFLSGSGYMSAVQPMKIIMPTLLFIGISNILGIQILVPLGREKIVLFSEIVGAIVNLMLNFILIPHFSSVGASVGTLAAEAVVMVIQYSFLKEMVEDIFKNIQYGKIFIALILASCLSIWVPFIGFGSFAILFVSSIAFFGSYMMVLLLLNEPLVVSAILQLKYKLRNHKF